jgi:hypothetical protein
MRDISIAITNALFSGFRFPHKVLFAATALTVATAFAGKAQTTPIKNGVLQSNLDAAGFSIVNLPSTEINLLLPSQTNNSGKFLTTDGTATFWSSLSQSSVAGLTVADSPKFAGLTATQTITAAQIKAQTTSPGFTALEKDGTDSVFTHTSKPTDAWRQGLDLMRFRLHRNSPDGGGGTDFLITPYEFGTAVEYGGVEEHWVDEFSVHKSPNKGNRGAVFWVGDDLDHGGAKITARIFSNGSQFTDIVSTTFDGFSHGPLRLRSVSTEGIYFQTGPDSQVQNNMTVAGYGIFMSRPVYFLPDGTVDIGANASRPRHYYGSGNITIGGNISAGGNGNFGGSLSATTVSASNLSTSGTLTSASISTGTVSSTGSSAGYTFQDRSSGNQWLLSSSANVLSLASNTGAPGSEMTLDSNGNAGFAGNLFPNPNAAGSLGTSTNKWKQLFIDQTLTPSGTTGPATINQAAGSVRVAPTQSSVTVTDSLCTANSLVFAVVRTNDATAYVKNVVPANGSFTINLGAAATLETEIGFHVVNQ